MIENKINDIKTYHHHMSGVYARQMILPKGWFAESHKHKFGHMSILGKGRAKVTVDGVETEYIAPAVIDILAGKVHSIVAIEDSEWFCIHAQEHLDKETLEPIVIDEVA